MMVVKERPGDKTKKHSVNKLKYLDWMAFLLIALFAFLFYRQIKLSKEITQLSNLLGVVITDKVEPGIIEVTPIQNNNFEERLTKVEALSADLKDGFLGFFKEYYMPDFIANTNDDILVMKTLIFIKDELLAINRDIDQLYLKTSSSNRSYDQSALNNIGNQIQSLNYSIQSLENKMLRKDISDTFVKSIESIQSTTDKINSMK